MVASPRVLQLVVPFSTSPLTAKLPAGTELTALELDERRLLDDATMDDGADELTAIDDGAEELGATDEGTTEERLEVVTTDEELGRLLLAGTCELDAPTMP